ncbi:MAG: FtsX-like permease family protein [Coriobacteriia bacterium]|nr:FtsX-like permease family protein [Coriobacteriia bacterium]
MSVLRDIFRRKGRSILTITGVGIGVFALVVLGAVAENMNVLLNTSSGYYDNFITVVEAETSNFVGMSLGSRPLAKEIVDEIRAYPGVRRVSPQVNIMIEDEFTGIPPMILGAEASSPDFASFETVEGRRLKAGERGAAVLGTDMAKKSGLEVGDNVTLRDARFVVVGIYGRTYMTALDAGAFVPLADAQQIYHRRLSEAFRDDVRPSDLVLQANVYGDEGVDLDRLSEQLTRDVDGVLASGPTKMKEAQAQIIDLVNAVLWSLAVVALIVGTVSVVNTMTMAVGERTREIGVKRALGATRRRVRRDVLAESALMAALGGIGGLVLGVLVALGLNAATVAGTGTSMFLVTPRLVVGTLAFAVVLGIVGGLWPARNAARLDPSAALVAR